MTKIVLKIERILYGTKLKQNKIQKFLYKKYLQWINGQCRHLCCFCDFKHECDIIEDNYIGYTIDLFEHK